MNYQRPPFEPLQYVPARDRETMLDLPIRGVDVVAHDPLENGGNHWCFYLNVTDTTSVQIDMTPSYNIPGVTNPKGSKGFLIISYLEHAVPISTTAQKVVRIEARPGCEARDFINLILSQKRHQYEFNFAGEGCRFWTTQQIDLFERSGFLINPSQVGAARDATLTKWPTEVGYPLVVGTYYP
ncbi:hypothetical protein BO83DRAFT_463407 [Aspergillus eucalypticola CBS 122712]|uniref:DUF7770 domain-containing protein n=1 Tax=Aspergillus eucalypticola (strain CBS 122712 / IBT 29274) TaxID=1448314 RepID=A0A317VRU3_ASPEC|nr:uncharacterized protein BO83DRAFT_463407 [Aspergillus eucalypticola CBS 122712]PWY75727.1 hypothetical protein BO83DRAFT_463407 [Aspergillus eucalypticola CBS 122712]